MIARWRRRMPTASWDSKQGKFVNDAFACDTNEIRALPANQLIGLRGFRRFEACRACETIGTAATTNYESIPPKPRPLLFATIALIALAVYGWSIYGLEITSRTTEGLL